MKNKNKFYITTPIYYPSAKPHMGHAYSSIVADVFARFKRLDNNEVFFLTGTDEHGLKIENAAKKNNQSPIDFCNDISKTFRDLTKILNLSNDDFIRTTETRHHKTVHLLWNKLLKNGDIFLSKYKGWYSVSDEAYYQDDEILNEGKNKIAKISRSKVEWVEEESFFFKLSAWQDRLLEFYNNNKDFIMPISRRNEVISFVKGGLKDLSVSRTSFNWGIKVPNNNKHVIYVWLDALTNYLSAINFQNKDNSLYRKFWPESLHIIGKDILRFHAVYWPAFLLSAGIHPPKKIFSHGWILSGDEKMSKSKGNILEPIDLINEFGLDQIRYYLMKEVSLGNDGKISRENLILCINSDLANNFGNLCQRILSFVNSKCENKIPTPKEFTSEDNELLNSMTSNIEKIRKLMTNQNLNEYIKFTIDYSFLANKYINDMEPWKLFKTDKNRMNTILYVALESIRKISILLSPVMPNSTNNILTMLNIDFKKQDLDSVSNNLILKPGQDLNKIKIIFKKF